MLAEGFLEIQLWEHDSHHFHRGNPCVYTGEAIFGVMSLFLRPFAPFSERVESAVLRLSCSSRFSSSRANTTFVERPRIGHTRHSRMRGGLDFLREGHRTAS